MLTSEKLTVLDVARELAALETTYRARHKRLLALLRVLESEQPKAADSTDEGKDDA